MNGGVAESAKIKKAAHAAGHTERIGAYRTDASRSKSLNGAMRSHNAADLSHLRRPSARCRRQSRGPQRSIPNRPPRR